MSFGNFQFGNSSLGSEDALIFSYGTDSGSAKVLGNIILGDAYSGLTAGFLLYIGGVSYSGNYQPGSLRIQDQLNSRNTASFKLVDLAQSVDFETGEEVTININGVLVFAGSVNEVDKEFPISGGVNFLSIRCVDHNAILDRFYVFANYEVVGQTLRDVVLNIINVQTILGSEEAITAIGVQDGPELGKLIFNGQSAREAFDDLSRITGYSWYVDYNRDLKFFDMATAYSPFNLTDSNAIYRSLTIKKTRESYRNIQYLRGGKTTTDLRTENLDGDGTRKVFTVEYPLDSKPAISVNSVAVDPANIGIRGVDQEYIVDENDDHIATNFEWFWKIEENEVSMNNHEDFTAPADGDTVSVTYIGQYNFIDQGISEEKIAERQVIEGYSGRYEEMEVDEKIRDIAIADYRIGQLLQEFGKIREELDFEVDYSGLRSGQLIQIQSGELGFDDQYLIDQITLQDIQGVRWRYQGKALNGRHVERWPEFFQKLFTAGVSATLRENELLIIFRETSEVYIVDDTLSYVESAITTTWDEDPYTVALIGYVGGIMSWPAGKGLIGEHPLL